MRATHVHEQGLNLNQYLKRNKGMKISSIKTIQRDNVAEIEAISSYGHQLYLAYKPTDSRTQSHRAAALALLKSLNEPEDHQFVGICDLNGDWTWISTRNATHLHHD